MEKKKRNFLIISFSILVISLTMCLFYGKALNEHLLWMYLDNDSLTILGPKDWQTIAKIKFPFNTNTRAWIPLLPMFIVIGYFTLLGKYLNVRPRLRGLRIHHYHSGLIAALVGYLFGHLGSDKEILVSGTLTTSSDIFSGLSVVLIIGGLFFVILDIRDLAEDLSKHYKRFRSWIRKED